MLYFLISFYFRSGYGIRNKWRNSIGFISGCKMFFIIYIIFIIRIMSRFIRFINIIYIIRIIRLWGLDTGRLEVMLFMEDIFYFNRRIIIMFYLEWGLGIIYFFLWMMITRRFKMLMLIVDLGLFFFIIIIIYMKLRI